MKTFTQDEFNAAVEEYLDRYDEDAFRKRLGLSAAAAVEVLDGAALPEMHERLPDDTQRILYLSRRHRAPGRLVRFVERVATEARREGSTAHKVAAAVGVPLRIARDILERRAYTTLYAAVGGTDAHRNAWLNMLRGGARAEAARGPR